MAPYRRKVRDESEAEELLAAWEASGERISDFCARRGVNWSSLAAYKTKMGHQSSPRGHLVETAKAGAEHGRYRVVFSNGHALELDGVFDDGVVRRLSAIVAAC